MMLPLESFATASRQRILKAAPVNSSHSTLNLRSSQSFNRVKALSGTTRRLPRLEVCLLAGFSVVATAFLPAPASARVPFPVGDSAQVALNLTYDKPAVIGAKVHATASGLPAG